MIRKGLLALCVLLPLMAGASLAQSADAPVRHVVVFKFKKDAKPEQIQKIVDDLFALKDKIPGIVSIEYGANNSPEGKDQGFTHVFLMTFKDVAARDAYLPHPDHKKFGGSLRMSGIYEGVLVFDYVPKS